MVNILQNIFPEEEWHPVEISRKNKKSRQRWLFLKIQEIFKNEVIHENYKHELKWNSGYFMEFDIYLPEKKLAIEFHGEQHYSEIPSAGFSGLKERKIRDKEKARICVENGINLVIVPFWWDNKLESLLEVLHTSEKELDHVDL